MPNRTNEEGGSHAEGLVRRLSSSGDDTVNARPKYTAPPRKQAKARGGCCAPTPPVEEVDVILVGGGIMSITVGLILKELEPSWKIVCFEQLGAVAEESSNGWNNAGTGHSALCEPNYTPWADSTETKIDIKKAITVNENWQLSRQYWSYLVKQGMLPDPNSFINVTPHITFAHGEDQLKWAEKRFEALKENVLFEGIEHSTDHTKMAQWCPLMFEGRDPNDKVSMTMVPYGTDVDFGALTKKMSVAYMKKGADLELFTTVSALKKEKEGTWLATVKAADVGKGKRQLRSKFVFVGAGGWALLLLQKTGIPEIKGFMGFPISGEFLVCQKEELAKKHLAKCYGKAAIGAPPMSVPHLDARIIGGKKMILFGPFAGFSPRYLKTGSLLDLLKAVKPHNLLPTASAGLKNLDLTIYLIKQLAATKSHKLGELQVFVPEAKPQDWTLATAGQRVQIMKRDNGSCVCGILQFGTEVVAAQDGTICGLLGASPGASTAVQVALDVLQKCFGSEGSRINKIQAWTPKIKMMVPSFGSRCQDDPVKFRQMHKETAAALNIK
jgi:malate dehydrogenase (quinone)